MAETFNHDSINIPFFAHESIIDRLDRTIRRLWILCIILFSLFVLTNGAWIYYEATITTETTMIDQEVQSDEGDNNLINAVGGEINYGNSDKAKDSD